jgi:hypothetical protein
MPMLLVQAPLRERTLARQRPWHSFGLRLSMGPCRRQESSKPSMQAKTAIRAWLRFSQTLRS